MAPTSISTKKSAPTQVNCTGLEVTARMPYKNSAIVIGASGPTVL